ncbi:unnamed protein product [Rotaria sp. Silwood1]|nr:unnamed protein product [Rotaria sp. Silwood1]
MQDLTKHVAARFYDIAQEPLQALKPIDGYDEQTLVSLEKAVEPLIPMLPEVHTYVYIAKERCENPTDGLTQDESAAIMLYSMDWLPYEQCLCFVLNSILREDDRRNLKPWLLYLKLFFTALSRLQSAPITVYHGIKMDLSEKYPANRTFTWWGFTLCTSSLDVLQSDTYLGKTGTRTMFIIESYSGKDIRRHSYFQREDSILLLAGSHFKVVSSADSGNGLVVIHLKQIQSIVPSLRLESVSNSPVILSSDLLTNMSTIIASPSVTPQLMKQCDDHTWKIESKTRLCRAHSSIDLSNEDLDDRDIPLVVQHAIIKKQCVILRLDKNKISSQGIAVLADALHNNTTLIGLKLDSNRILDLGLHSLTQLLSENNSALEQLLISTNEITNKGAQYLAEMLKRNHRLTKLGLNNNQIGDVGVQSLANALAYYNTSLRELSLRGNKLVTSSSVDSLIELIKHNRSLLKIDLSNCTLSTQDHQRLLQASAGKQHFKLRFGTEVTQLPQFNSVALIARAKGT